MSTAVFYCAELITIYPRIMGEGQQVIFCNATFYNMYKCEMKIDAMQLDQAGFPLSVFITDYVMFMKLHG